MHISLIVLHTVFFKVRHDLVPSNSSVERVQQTSPSPKSVTKSLGELCCVMRVSTCVGGVAFSERMVADGESKVVQTEAIQC